MASLPPEIWLQIFRCAVEDRSSSLKRFELGPNDEYDRWRETKGYKDSLATKLALVKTCREWNSFATPLLYEHISLSTVQQCELLLQSFTRRGGTGLQTSGAAGASGDYLRRLVSRLDLYWSDQDLALGPTVQLCSLLPEVQALVISLGLYEEEDPSTLLNALPPHLRHLFWLRDSNGPGLDPEIPLSSVVSLLSDNSELASVSLPFRIEWQPNIRVSPNFRCPSIRTLVLRHHTRVAAMSRLPKDAFPSLRFVNAAFHSSETCPCLLEFLSTHANKASIVSFTVDDHHAASGPDCQLLRHLGNGGYPIAEVHVQVHEPDSAR